MRKGQFENMAVLASELNYTDQSHFIKEVEAFSGRRPTALCKAILAPQTSQSDVNGTASSHGAIPSRKFGRQVSSGFPPARSTGMARRRLLP